MQQILKTYQNRLINISANNRSLLLRKLFKEQFIDLHDFDFALNQPSFNLIKSLIGRNNKIPLCRLTDSRDESANILSKRLRRLQRREQLLFEEHGSKDLYVGWPFVEGKFSEGTPVRCPLLFFPVEIVLNDSGWILRQREDVNITLNKTFLIAYGHYHEVKIGEDLLERVFDDFDTDSMVFRTGLYHLLKESLIELNFNQDNFIDKLERFRDMTKKDFDERHKAGMLKLYPNAVLGIFPQSGSYLVPDYDYIIENRNFGDLSEFFETKIPADIPGDRYGFLTRVKEEETYTPFKMDAYQENAIKAVKKGMSVVIQGPPGTGKSQVICNLMADHMARGKKVLLVCQKRAALDVVYERFDEVEMSEFLGLIHDFKNDRKGLYQKIDRQINSIESYKLSNNSLDAFQLERQFLQQSRRIDQITEELEELKSALYNNRECGISVKELYLTSEINGESIGVKQEYKNFNFQTINEVFSRFKNYIAYAKKYELADYPLLTRRSFANHSIAALRRMQEHLDEIEFMHSDIGEATRAIAGAEISIEECMTLIDKKETMKEFLSLAHVPETYAQLTQLSKVHTTEEEYSWYSDRERVLLDALEGDGIELSIKHAELGEFQKSLQKAIKARRSLIKFLQWRLFSKDRAWVIKVLTKNKLTVNAKGLKTLIRRIDNRLNLEHNLTLIQEKGWVNPFQGRLNKASIVKWARSIHNAFRAKMLFTSFRNFTEYFPIHQNSEQELVDKIERLYQKIDHIPIAWAGWQVYFTVSQLRKLTTDSPWFNRFRIALDRDFESLCQFDLLKQEMPSYELHIIEHALEGRSNQSPEQIVNLIDNSLRLQWIEHIETKYPILRSVSSLKFLQLEQELQENVRNKLKISQQILMLRAKEQTFIDAEYNRLNNMVTYRDLGHQVTKQRRIWPLRKLFANFSEEIFHLIPCWLASPETVSAVFPMIELFDIVIFDEASQCFTERGIPAMYRGKQMVVAGDNKQLRPNDIYQIRLEEDSDESALEVDSLLELASQYLMDVHLQGHYRSRKPELIDFSNMHFYGGSLRMLPDRDLVNNGKAAIEYVKVTGSWEKQTNLTEAQKVVHLLQDIVANDPAKSVGIVTFNVYQQDLIFDLIDELEASGQFTRPENLIVKNIENIQGDEKDIIIFSTGYAPDQNGKLIMQFGSLNVAGGENRLNVAITRAREKVYLVTSIWPQELKVNKLKNEGPKLLKAYMEYARKVSENDYQPEPLTAQHISAEWYLKSRLENWLANKASYEIGAELPFADIAVAHNGKYLGVINTDDDHYFQSPSVKDAHVYTPFTLSAKKWKFKGVFSRNFWLNPEALMEELRVFINQIQGD